MYVYIYSCNVYFVVNPMIFQQKHVLRGRDIKVRSLLRQVIYFTGSCRNQIYTNILTLYPNTLFKFVKVILIRKQICTMLSNPTLIHNFVLSTRSCIFYSNMYGIFNCICTFFHKHTGNGLI